MRIRVLIACLFVACGGGSDTGETDTDTTEADTSVSDTSADDERCTRACERLVTCQDLICDAPIYPLSECLTLCNPDPDGFTADAITASSCEVLQQELCTLNGAADACECPSETGGATCAETYECLVDCGSAETSCPDACEAAASDVGLSQLQAMNQCIGRECGDEPFETLNACVDDNCGDRVEACFGPSEPSPAYCLEICAGNGDCESNEFCFYYGAINTQVCAEGTAQQPTFPAGAPDCSATGVCEDNAVCVPTE